jgi:hypothetical protein
MKVVVEKEMLRPDKNRNNLNYKYSR